MSPCEVRKMMEALGFYCKLRSRTFLSFVRAASPVPFQERRVSRRLRRILPRSPEKRDPHFNQLLGVLEIQGGSFRLAIDNARCWNKVSQCPILLYQDWSGRTPDLRSGTFDAWFRYLRKACGILATRKGYEASNRFDYGFTTQGVPVTVIGVASWRHSTCEGDDAAP